MFTMKLITDSDKLAEVGKRNGLTQQTYFAYACEENNAITASCVYRLLNGLPVVVSAESGEHADPQLLDGIVRAVFSHLSMNGFEEVLIDGSLKPAVLQALKQMRFPIGERIDIEYFFDTVKNCGAGC